jgi:hypothetical protein
MIVDVMITGVDLREGENEKGKYSFHVISGIEMSKSERCKTPLEFRLDKRDSDLVGPLQAACSESRTVKVGITELGVYKNRLQVQAHPIRASLGVK